MRDLPITFHSAPPAWVTSDAGYLLVILALAVVVALPRLRGLRRRRYTSRRKNFRKNFHSISGGKAAFASSTPSGMADPEAQIAAVAKVSFEKRRLMNKGEYEVFRLLERTVAEIGGGHRVMAQTSLGELIQPRTSSGTEAARRDAYASINSKRLDFAIVDKFGLLALAVEYQGSGHYHHKTFMRDAVKREALRRAGVELVEVPAKWEAGGLAGQVRTAIGINTAASAS